MISGIVASAAVSSDKLLTKVLIILFSTVWGMFCGLLAGILVFAIIAAIYSSFPLQMTLWESAVWGGELLCFVLLDLAGSSSFVFKGDCVS